MSNLASFLEQMDKIKDLPWKGFLWLVAGSFICASLLSSLAGELFMPEVAQNFKQTPKVLVNVPPKEKASLDEAGIQDIVQRNIFNIEGKTGDDEGEEQQGEEQEDAQGASHELVKSTLPLKLLGTIFGGDPYSGIALIENAGKKTMNSFFVGDFLAPGIKVVEIYREKVILLRGEQREYLEVEKKERVSRRKQRGPVSAPPKLAVSQYATEPPPDTYKEEGFERQGNNIVLSSDFRQKLLTTDFAKVLQDAKAEPHFVNGELGGFRLTRIRQDSIYQKAGLQNGDVIKEINGVSLVDTAQAIKLLNSLRGENEIEVRLERGGSTMNLQMQVR